MLRHEIFAGAFKRLFAFTIDISILNVCFLILYFLFKLSNILTTDYWIIFFIIFCFYFAIFDSIIFKGQSVGKKYLNITVRNLDGGYTSTLKALGRSFYIGCIYFLFPITKLIHNHVVIHSTKFLPNFAISALFFALIFGTIVFMIFHPYNQSIYDLWTKTMTVCRGYDKNTNIEEFMNHSRYLAAFFLTIILTLVFSVIYAIIVQLLYI